MRLAELHHEGRIFNFVLLFSNFDLTILALKIVCDNFLLYNLS